MEKDCDENVVSSVFAIIKIDFDSLRSEKSCLAS